MRRSFLILAVAAIAPLLATAQEVDKIARVVIQVSDADPARWNLVLNNAANLREELGANKVMVEIVAYGPGIGMLRFDAPTNSRVTETAKNGVAIRACENTMRNQKLTRADMHPSITYVAAGVVEIVRRQQEGWAYLRP